MKALGWISSIFGGILLVYSISQRDTTDYKWASGLGLNSDEVTSINTYFYIGIGLLIVGVIFLIIGYLNSGKKAAYNRNNPYYYQQTQTICPVCRTVVPVGTATCPCCGNQLVPPNMYAPPMMANPATKTIVCNNCKAQIPSDSQFCSKCGSKIAQ